MSKYYERPYDISKSIHKWFEYNRYETKLRAIVGFSGGIDSAVTAALCSKAGIPTTIVLANAPNQIRSSNYCPYKFSELFDNMDVRVINFENPMESNEAKEAALPILRNACFYGVAADARAKGEFTIVVGTANFDEAAYLGFWGKASDAAQDFYPISHLHKENVRDIALYLNLPKEIIYADPSGDLLYSGETNDLKMIGCDYRTVEKIAMMAKNYNVEGIVKEIENMPDPKTFCNQVEKNYFKYNLPFPGVHLKPHLETFRKNYYWVVRKAISYYTNPNLRLIEENDYRCNY